MPERALGTTCAVGTNRTTQAASRAGKDFVSLGADNARMTGQDETRKMLAYVAARMGGIEQLASRLDINETTASQYVTGKEVIPDAIVLRVVDLVLEGIPEQQT